MFENVAGERQIHSSPQERTCDEVAVPSPALSGILRRSLSVDQVICEESGEDEEESKVNGLLELRVFQSFFKVHDVKQRNC